MNTNAIIYINSKFDIILEKRDIKLKFVNNEFINCIVDPLIFTSSILYRKAIEEIYKFYNDEKNVNKPCIILSSLTWIDLIEGKKIDNIDSQYYNFVKDYSYSSFIFNSSIWIHYTEIVFKENGELDNVTTEKNYKKCIEHFNRIKIFDPYKKSNAIEYIEYQFRLQQYNYLETKFLSSSSSGHGKFIAPILYSNEQKLRADIGISDELNFFFNFDKNNKKSVKGINLRILLIDDKIGSKDDCKASLIKNLLELQFEQNEEVTDQKMCIQNRVCWLTPDHRKTDDYSVIVEEVKFYEDAISTVYPTCKKILDLDENKIQIIAVKNLKLARKLLSESSLHFDLIMMDYLLAENENGNGEREYATEFWGDGDVRFFELNDKKDDFSIKETYSKIKANRGPMQRLWIFPITAFNQTFIDDLRNKGIRLIDNYWYLSRGADPINTPYLFISALNKFLQLQIEQAIYSYHDLFGFLKKSAEKIENLLKVCEKDTSKIPTEELKYLFGSEYIYFISNYAMEEQINRDASQGSLFANYIQQNFFENTQKFGNLHKLNRAIRKLYHSLAYGEPEEMEECVALWYRVKDILALIRANLKDEEDPKKELKTKVDSIKLDTILESIDKRFVKQNG